MRALVLKSYEKKKSTVNDFPMAEGAPLASFAIESLPDPVAGPGETLVRIHAAAVNALDVRVQAGLFPYSIDAPLILGNEGAGVVESSARFERGTRVMVMGFPLGVSRHGTHQELMVVPDDWVYPLPSTFGFEHGAAFLVAYLTAQLALDCAAHVKPDDWVVVTGATGTIGRAVVQLAKAQGAKPISVVSATAKVASAEEDGPSGVIDLSRETLEAGAKRITGGSGADLAVDPVGGKDMGRLLPALRRRGTLVSVGYLAGKMASIVIPYLVGWSRSIVGVDLFEEPAEDVQRASRTIFDLAERGLVKPRIDCTLPVEQWAEAFERVASRRAVGKVVLSL